MRTRDAKVERIQSGKKHGEELRELQVWRELELLHTQQVLVGGLSLLYYVWQTARWNIHLDR